MNRDAMEELTQKRLTSQDHDSTSLRSVDDTDDFRARHRVWPEGYAFEKYRVIRVLGSGVTAVVYLAEDQKLRRNVAIKVSHGAHDRSARQTERFRREAESVAQLRHPNLCQVHETGSHDGRLFIVMSFVDGPTLAEWWKDESPTEMQVAMIIRSVAAGLQEAHDHGFVHRDLKPDNILMDRQGHPVVTDFGLALSESIGISARITQPGLIVGSPGYMSPEQIRNASEVGPPSDIYSLGVVMYELLCGTLPFTGEVLTVIRKIALNEAKPPSTHRAELSPEIDEICMRAIAKDPEHRFATMEEFAQTLNAFIDSPHHRRNKPDRVIGGTLNIPNVSKPWVLAAISLTILVATTLLFYRSRNGTAIRVGEDGVPVSSFISGQEEYRLNLLNQLLVEGLQIDHDGETLESPMREIPARVDSVSLVNMGIADVDDFRAVLEVVPESDHLQIRTDDFSVETWELLIAAAPKDLWIQADHLTPVEMDFIGYMQHLESLRLHCPTIDDESIHPVSGLINLASLAVSGSKIRGACISFFTEMENLERLELSDCPLGDKTLRELKELPRLTHLAINETPITGSRLAFVSTLPQLLHLNVGYTNLRDSDLLQVAACPHLKELILEGCGRVSDLSPLTGLSLTHLDLCGTQVSDLTPLKAMPLQDLYLDDDRNYDFSVLESRPIVNAHQTVDFESESIATPKGGTTDSSFESRLRQLNALAKEGISFDRDLHTRMWTPLDRVPNRLWCLDTTGIEISDRQLGKLVESAPAYERLRIRPARLSDSGWAELSKSPTRELVIDADLLDAKHWHAISKMSELTHLEIDCPSVRDDDLRPISSLENLTYLGLNGTSIDGSCFSRFQRMEDLQCLDLVGTLVNDRTLRDLPPLPSLTILNLCGSHADGSFIASLARFPALRYLNLGDTALTSDHLAAVKLLPQVKELILHDTPWVTDLSPLAETNIEVLDITRSGVRDFSPLRNTKITDLVIDDDLVEDRWDQFPDSLLRINARSVEAVRRSLER
ncbi:MAG: protein kinase [Planctomycetota bacterium]